MKSVILAAFKVTDISATLTGEFNLPIVLVYGSSTGQAIHDDMVSHEASALCNSLCSVTSTFIYPLCKDSVI